MSFFPAQPPAPGTNRGLFFARQPPTYVKSPAPHIDINQNRPYHLPMNAQPPGRDASPISYRPASP